MKKLFLLLLLLTAFSVQAQSQQAPKRELRGAWIATVANIDWPSKQALPDEEQQKEMIKMLDEFKSYNLNTVVFQIRPTADAFYRSTKEPASHWITGEQGVAPGYDPLQFVIDQCDKRGMSVHVWLNPYRVEMDTTKGQHIADSHLFKSHPEYFVTYGKTRYFNPGLDQTRDFVKSVVSEIVANYNIDAIHMDDYFYPYKIKGQDFPDQAAFEKNPRGFTDKEAWRRNNVDLIIKEIHEVIVATKPTVEFGISPFGVWRNADQDPRGSKTQAGVTNYDDLYADIIKWQQEGWIDYVTPQLYWNIGYKVADFEILAKWWSENSYGAKVYIGQAPFLISEKSKNEAWRNEQEIIKQLDMLRANKEVHGSVYFSGKSMYTEDKLPANHARKAMKEKMVNGVYKYHALAPEANRNVRVVPTAPTAATIKVGKDKATLSWQAGENNRRYVVYRTPKNGTADFENTANIVDITGLTTMELSTVDTKKFNYYVSALSPTQAESEPTAFKN